MRIAQIIAPSASEYERKCQRIDFAALSAEHEIVDGDADLTHVYGPATDVREPFVASERPHRPRWSFARRPEPRYVVSPAPQEGEELLPEAVEELWFGASGNRPATDPPARDRPANLTIGSYGSKRPGVRNQVEQTLSRIHRFRNDVEWLLLDEPPSPATLTGVDVWVDPATDPRDFDGFVAEALVVGIQVVASRTPINATRLEKGRTGFLVPPADPNEMTHAILAALFKPEVAGVRLQSARQTVSKFRARQRLRVLTHLYQSVLS